MRTRGRRLARVTSVGFALALAAGCGEDPLRDIRDLQERGLYQESLEPLAGVLVDDPGNSEALLMQGRAFVKLGRPNRALPVLRRAAGDPRWVDEAGVLRATGLLQARRPDDAIVMTSRVLRRSPDNADALRLRATARAAADRDLAAGLADAERALAIRPGDAAAMIPQAELLLALDRTAEAGAVLHQLESRWAEEDPALADEGLALEWCVARARLATAQDAFPPPGGLFAKCLVRFADRTRLQIAAERFYSAAGEDESAEAILRARLRGRPLDLDTRRELARSLVDRGEVAEATALLLEGERIASGEHRFRAQWALVEHFEEQGRFALAADAAERAIALQSDPRLPFRLVDILVRAGDLERARATAATLEGQAYIDLAEGRILLAEGRPAEALVRLDAGLAAWPENAGAHYFAALAAEQAGDLERAAVGYRESARLDPDATDAAGRLDDVLRAAAAKQP